MLRDTCSLTHHNIYNPQVRPESFDQVSSSNSKSSGEIAFKWSLSARVPLHVAKIGDDRSSEALLIQFDRGPIQQATLNENSRSRMKDVSRPNPFSAYQKYHK